MGVRLLVLINEKAGAGKAGKRWKASGRSLLKSAGLDGQNIELMKKWDCMDLIRKIEDGERFIISAGGDGTFNRLMSCVMSVDEKIRDEMIIGALGFGSSNDLHKPFARKRMFDGIPYLLDRSSARSSNVIRIDAVDENGKRSLFHSVVNSSIGVVAFGNEVFNRGKGITGLLKRISEPMGIYSSALVSIFRSAPIRCRMILNGRKFDLSISNAGILLNHHFTGSLKYDTPVDRYQDHFLVNVAERMSIGRSLASFLAISRGKFKGRKGCYSWKTDHLRVVLEKTAPLEYDGEVVRIREAEFSLLRGSVRICG